MREEKDEFSAAAGWLVGVTFGGKLCMVDIYRMAYFPSIEISFPIHTAKIVLAFT